MFFIPKEKPVIENLNSYYLDIQRLVEHYQGALGSGGVHLKSATTEVIIFFDENNILNLIFRDKDGQLTVSKTLKKLADALVKHAFSVAVYKIEAEDLYFWINLQNVKQYYTNLSSEFTDLDGLIKKMRSENITGFIEVSVGKGREKGIVFFNNGAVIGCSCSWDKGVPGNTSQNQKLLIQKSKELGGVFNVSRVSMPKMKARPNSADQTEIAHSHLLTMVQDLLGTFEKAVQSNTKFGAEFDTLLRRKFVEKVDIYDFLDPFAAEFQYSEGKVKYTGKADSELVVKGVLESVAELADELGIRRQLPGHLDQWAKKYSKEIARFNLNTISDLE